ncbi:MAG: class I SAM-dependent methyltransferase [Solirubrobacterales bacterium]
MNRLRWIAKYRIVRDHDIRLRDDLRTNLRFVLWDPELESHSYEIDNEDELVTFVAELLGAEPRDVERHVEETRSDPELNERLARRTRWRFDVKTRPPAGNRLLWYALARSLKPRLIVETGIYQGLGSLVLLRALERNADEGVEGELLSIDVDPEAGRLVEPGVAARWRKVVGMTTDVLERELDGRSVQMLVQDTPHTYENQAFEFGAALAHAGDRLVLVDSGGGRTPALSELCKRAGGTHRHFRERPHDHFYPTRGSGVALIERRS